MAMTIDDLRELFIRKCTNSYRAVTVVSGKEQPMRYQREDLTKWAAEAYARGEAVFYASYVDESNPNGAMYLDSPIYVYNLIRSLTEQEYFDVFGVEALNSEREIEE